MHQLMAATLDEVLDAIAAIQQARARGRVRRAGPRWPMIVLRTPKGWTGPKDVDGLPIEGTFRAHQVPLADFANNPDISLLEDVDAQLSPRGAVRRGGRGSRPRSPALAPVGDRRMGANPHANGGLLLRDLELPDFRDYAVEVPAPGTSTSEATRVLGGFLRDVDAANHGPELPGLRSRRNGSNRLDAVFEVTDRIWVAETLPTTITWRPTAA